MSIVLVEQNARLALKLAHHAYALEHGEIVRTGRGDELLAAPGGEVPFLGAIIVEAMIEKGILALTGDVLKATLHRAAVAAGITCSRKGAQPPYKHELKNV
jgi:ABC-type proline/glycine betaine transport system ATPase subunit